MRTFTITCAAAALFTGAAFADPLPNGAGDFSRGFGMGWESFDTPINPSTRDEHGNRTIVNGRISVEGSLSGGLQDFICGVVDGDGWFHLHSFCL